MHRLGSERDEIDGVLIDMLDASRLDRVREQALHIEIARSFPASAIWVARDAHAERAHAVLGDSVEAGVAVDRARCLHDGRLAIVVPVVADEDDVNGRIFDDCAAVKERIAEGVAAAEDAHAAAVFVANHVGRIGHIVSRIVRRFRGQRCTDGAMHRGAEGDVEDGMDFDSVRRDAGLAVEEVPEADASDRDGSRGRLEAWTSR